MQTNLAKKAYCVMDGLRFVRRVFRESIFARLSHNGFFYFQKIQYTLFQKSATPKL